MNNKIIYNALGFVAVVVLILLGTSPQKALENVRVVREAASEFLSLPASASATPAPSDASSAPASVGDTYAVVKVVDGDTIDVSLDGHTQPVRMIGINTPEVDGPYRAAQCFGKEASMQARELITGHRVRLETDPTQGERDKYDRTLAYVWRDDGLFINKYMVENGYAYEYTYDEPYKYRADFKAAQKIAEAQKRGLWADDACR